ncbi:MAG: hypothetical protein C7M88_09890 [Candidatus Arcticimaribacter sp.]|nr:MAG: hypothetical protein C7M88_09890 [Candidatus Arcticimaribacter sp.]
MNIRFLLFLCLSVITNLYAQQVEISGTIISSEDDLPVIGANILLKGQNVGTSSDFDGNYAITANIGDILQYSYLGFETQEIVIGDQKLLLVTLVPDT